MHGPNHLFCCGVASELDPLARAAWAGYLSSRGEHSESERWAKSARDAAGKVLIRHSTATSTDALEVRLIGSADRPKAEDLGTLIEVLSIMLGALRRVEEIEGARAKEAGQLAPEGTAPVAGAAAVDPKGR